MAISPSHKFGQIIGDFLEETIEPLLREFAKRHNLYLDTKGVRSARKGKKVRWKDQYGNFHDLDFVLERNGSDENLGEPVAFIESAWRRYTKHSRNKAQEIQGALLPLIETYHESSPFMGVILAGVFTEGALTQLRSLGFSVLFLPELTLIQAFKRVDLDLSADEKTPDKEFAKRVDAFEKLPEKDKRVVSKALLEFNAPEIKEFIHELDKAVNRKISSVVILPLYGKSSTLNTVEEALSYMKSVDETCNTSPLIRFEIIIQYNNGDSLKGSFENKLNAIAFLNNYR